MRDNSYTNVFNNGYEEGYAASEKKLRNLNLK